MSPTSRSSTRQMNYNACLLLLPVPGLERKDSKKKLYVRVRDVRAVAFLCVRGFAGAFWVACCPSLWR